MQLWRIEEEGFEEAQVSSVGNKYLIGNGYLGVRGTLQEYKNEQLTAINLAGIYDQVGDGWREPLNAPNGLYTYLEFNGKELRLPQTPATTHKIALNFRHSIFERETSWSVGDTNVKIKAERFASYDRQHLLAMKYSITVDQEGECSIYTGIDGRVWDINGPHYDEILFTEQDNSLQVKAITHESKDQVYVCEAISTEFGVYTSKDTPQYEDVALSLLEEGCKEGYEITLSKHVKEWEKSWKASEVLIAGDDQAMQALNYSIYHLLCIAPRHTDQLSIAARGLSGQTYKGAVFWDTEMFMLDFFLFTDPKVAKTLLKYRIDTLEGAKIKAKQYGYQGAFYAWESQEGGYDACSDYNVTDVFTGRPMRTYFKD
ncbi:MAG: Kojibiose phosphorylase, partial [Herbinix sp.]|nr:Kojibiose phosphorylase [Herbinix sp.]